MESASTSQDGDPSFRVAPKLSVGRTADGADELPSPSSSHEAPQNNTRADTQPYTSSQSEVDPELAGLDALEDGRPGERPAYPFTTLIRYAIKGSPNGRLLLEDIYNAIQTRYPYFASAPSGWKNSVRHTLSLMTCFEKVSRLLTEPGKGSYWTVNDSMPHAKPSRVRIRKRKTRVDDDNTLPEAPRSVPNPLYPESPVGENPKGSEWHRHLFPYDHPGVSARRHSSHAQTNAHDQLSRYDYNLDKASRSYRSSNDSPWVGNGQPHVGGRVPEISELEPSYPNSDDSPPTSSRHEGHEEHEGGSITAGETATSKPVNYRSVLMSELDRLRDVIAKRDDIDDEWCRVMAERIRGTGLLEQV